MGSGENILLLHLTRRRIGRYSQRLIMIWLLSMRALSAHSAGMKEPLEAQGERGGERTEWHSSSRTDVSFVSAGNQSKCDEDSGSRTKRSSDGIELT
jgi:hypothetical protein